MSSNAEDIWQFVEWAMSRRTITYRGKEYAPTGYVAGVNGISILLSQSGRERPLIVSAIDLIEDANGANQ